METKLTGMLFNLTVGVLLLCLSLPGFTDEPVKRALLIGIDDYQAVSDLNGCVNDIELIKQILTTKFEVSADNIRMLKNAQATRANIIQTIKEHLIDQAQPGDVVILHYSGHGSQMRDLQGGDEIDGWDETIVPHDSRTADVFDISDDEINGLMGQLTERTKNVTFILDSCHSGAAARAGNKVRMVEPDDRAPPPAADFAFSTRAGEGDADFRLNGSDYVLISGCLATELSNETQFGGRRHGAMTWFLAQALQSAQPDSTYRSVMDSVRADVTNQFPSQHPQIEGPGMDLRLFGTDKINARPYVLVDEVEGNNLQLSGGAILGLQNDLELRLFSPGTADFDNSDSIAVVKVTAVESFSAQATIEEGGPVVVGSKALIEISAFGSTPIALYLDPTSSQSLAEIKSHLSELNVVELVDSPELALLSVVQQDQRITVQTGDLEQLTSPVLTSEPDHVEQITNRVKDIVHWRTLRDLRNPFSDLQIEFDFEISNSPDRGLNPSSVTPGERVTYRVKNTNTDRALYLYVLDVSSDGSVGLLYPPAGEQQTLAPGATLKKEIEMYLPQGLGSVTDVLKVIATTEPIEPFVFPQGSLRDAGPPPGTRAGQDPLTLFLADASRGMRASRPVNVGTWVTKERPVVVRPPEARTSGFTLHFDQAPELENIPQSLGASRNVCPQGEDGSVTDCFNLRSIDRANTTFEINSEALSRSDSENRSIGAIFDEAYLIQDQTGASRVEPRLEVQSPGLVDQQGIDKREILGDSAHDEAAISDDLWSLKQIRVSEAWQKIRDRYGIAEGHEGDSVLVAHTDTGYLPHPENWEEQDGRRPIDPSKGYDYFDRDNDPTDPLLDDRKLDNPGHGTASGSVIVSPEGCQLEDTPGCVNGVARGAQLIPLRVNRTVSQFDTSNLAQAIRDTAEGNIEGSPQLISTAMGGPPTFNLYKAVKAAENNGVLMVAAAGNYVRTVVWPARFRSTIAAAAVNVRCRPWKHSSRGRKVDISAPGESVWRATLNKDREYINYMGKGTTFATGNTAAAAALWLAWHKDDPALESLRQQGQLTRTFRQALAHSAWQPTGTDSDPAGTHCSDADWDGDNFGPGIIDISALLEVPLTVTDTRSGGLSATEEVIPLFASLYPDDTPAEQIRTDYRSLLGAEEGASIDGLKNFETEIMHHYTLDPNVQRTLEAVVQGQRGDESTERARISLLDQDLSGRLKALLMTGVMP
ncbi:MAG: caspase family protein [bacterium]